MVKETNKKSAATKPIKKESEVVKVAAKKIKVASKSIKAMANFVHVSPRKVRLLAAQLRGADVDSALNNLNFLNKSAARPLAKLINSAVANAENNFQYEKKDLFIQKLDVNEGPVLKRFRPRAHGRSTMIRKKTSHIILILGVKAGAKQIAKKTQTEEKGKKDTVKVVAPGEVKKQLEGVGAPKHDDESKGGKDSGFLKKVFSRKTG